MNNTRELVEQLRTHYAELASDVLVEHGKVFETLCEDTQNHIDNLNPNGIDVNTALDFVKKVVLYTSGYNSTTTKISEKSRLIGCILTELINNNQPVTFNCFDYESELADYNTAVINTSSIKYSQALEEWSNYLLATLNQFHEENNELFETTHQLHNYLHDNITLNDNVADDIVILAERDEYLQQYLNFNITTLYNQLLNIKEQSLKINQQLLACANSPNVLIELNNIQQIQRQPFEVIAEYTGHLVKQYLQRIEWFEAYQEDILSLVETHYRWVNNFDYFTSTDYNNFLYTTQREQIDVVLAETWFAEWRQQRRMLEQQLLPLYQLTFNQQCSTEIAQSVLDILQQYQQQIDQLYKKERLACHQRYAFTPNGSQQEQCETQLHLFKLASQFQTNFEDILFSTPDIATRVQLLSWSEAITQQHFSNLSQQTELSLHQNHNDIWQSITQELRQLQQRTLETFIQDAAYFSQERKKRDDELNSLVYRMRKELQKTG